MTYRIDILNWHPAKVNELLGHWAKAARRKKFDAELLAVECHNAGIPKATSKRWLFVEIHVAGRGRSPDPDAFAKSLRDGLKACGMIVDDSSKWLEAGDAVIVRGPVKKTVIVLEDCE